MIFELKFTIEADTVYQEMEDQVRSIEKNRKKNAKNKSSKQEGLFKQVTKTLSFLIAITAHP
ncbi:MAG: hypothetical protein HQK49_14670 [Oligoflexia bacterium]|nr:hypothetical protein [Oligoflexia bacterium]